VHDVDLGDGDDRLAIFGEGHGDVTSHIDAGAGRDSVKYKMLFAPLILDRDGCAQLNLDVLLGLGSDTVEIETFEYCQFDTTIDNGPAGEGRDTVATSHVFLPSRDLESRIRLMLDGGLDTADFFALGYDTHTVEQIGDTATHEVGHWLG
jgi:hypothetical protein